jgi:RNA polymerase sigma-70 factor, ECF subfamily
MTHSTGNFRRELVAVLPRLRRFACALSGSRTDAEDLVQSAVERALRHNESWQEGTRLDSWMFRIIQNLWRDELRAHRRRNVPLEDIGEVADHAVSDAAFQRIELDQARTALATLSLEQREVIGLVVLDGMSYAEAAATLEIPVGTVMSRLARARGALVSKLASEARPKLAKPP